MGAVGGDDELVGLGLLDVELDEDELVLDHVGFGSKPPGSLQRNYIAIRTVSMLLIVMLRPH